MRQERKLAIAALVGAAAFILLTDPDLIQELAQIVKIERPAKTDGSPPVSG